MAHDPSQPEAFGPIGHCIYCGSPDDPRIEHIVAEGLGGRYELKGASCVLCGDKTSKFEMKVLRGIYHAPRAKFGMLSGKRKKQHPKEWPIEIDFGTRTEPRKVPIAKHPTFLFGVMLAPPTLLMGVPYVEDKDIRFVVRPIDANSQKLIDDLGPRVKVAARWEGIAFAQMLAKIAHAYAWSQLGDGFKPLLNDIILNEPTEFPLHLVGGAMVIPPASEQLHEIELMSEWADYLVVRLRLFASRDMPVYYIIVGSRGA